MLTWHWTPGAGGLLALVSPQCVADELQGVVVPDGAHPVRPLHLTCLASRSMAPLVGLLDPDVVLAALPHLPLPRFRAEVFTAERAPHPTKDPPDCVEPRRTGFLAVTPTGQERCKAVVAHAVAVLDRLARAAGGDPFVHPEPRRFFHLSVWNNRGGDAMRSIGDIGRHDLAR